MPRKVSTLGPSISIRKGAKPEAKQTAAAEPEPAYTPTAPQAAATPQNPLTPESVRNAWLAFGSSRTSEHILASTLRTCIPTPIEGSRTDFRIMYESPAQADVLEKWLPVLTREIGQSLGNSTLRFIPEQITGEGSPLTWTERQVLDHLLEKHESLRKLVETLHLSLN